MSQWAGVLGSICPQKEIIYFENIMTKEIQLTQGKVSLVDDEDFEYFNQRKWQAHKHRNTFYAARNEGMFPFRKTIYLHREIATVPNGMDVDHKDGNGLNNTRKNLRVCTELQNNQNKGKYSNNTTGYKGVYWHGARKKWHARIAVNGKRISLGLFPTAEQAAHAYDEAAKKYFGEFANLNFG